MNFLSRVATFFRSLREVSSVKTSSSAWARAYGAGIEGNASGGDLEKPYQDSIWLNAGIRLVTSQLTRVPLEWYADDALTTLSTDKNRDAWWKTPALRAGEKMNRSETIATLGSWMLLAGEACVVLGDDWLLPGRAGRAEARTPFIVAKPHRLQPIEDRSQGTVAGWRFTDGAGKQFNLLPEQVLRLVAFNPYDDCRGLGAYEPARVEVAADAYAAKFSRNVAASNGQQATYIVTDGSAPTPEQQQQIVAQLREKQRRIERGDFAPVFLPGGLKVEDPHARAVDAAFIQQRIEHRHAIAAALGIPMSMFDVAASYSVGAASDLYRLITFTCEPFGNQLAELLNRIEERRSGSVSYAGFRWSDHPVLQQARMERFEKAGAMWDRGIPWSVLNETLRLELPEFEGEDTGWIDFGKQPVADALSGNSAGFNAPDPTNAPADPTLADPVQQAIARAKKLFALEVIDPKLSQSSNEPLRLQAPASRRERRIAAHSPKNAGQSAAGIADEPGDDGTQQAVAAPAPLTMGARAMDTKAQRARARLWQKHMASQAPHMRRMHSAVGKVLAKYRRKLLDELPTALPQRSVSSPLLPVPSSPSLAQKGVIDFIFDLGSFTADIIGAIRQVTQKTLLEAGKAALVEMGLDALFEPKPDWVRSYLAQRENIIRDASANTFEQIKNNIQAGIDAGETMDELTDRVKDAFSGVDKGRARVIAQTETATAFNVARQASQEQAGITHKEWVSAQDDRVRDTHAEVDGQIVPVDEPFLVNGIEMMHPCADGAPPEEVINCRCICVGSIKLPEDV